MPGLALPSRRITALEANLAKLGPGQNHEGVREKGMHRQRSERRRSLLYVRAQVILRDAKICAKLQALRDPKGTVSRSGHGAVLWLVVTVPR